MGEDFEREKLCYEQNFEQFRALNAQMNRIPAFSVTLTGGLWFGAGLIQNNLDSTIRFALLLYAGLSNLALIAISYRIRDVMSAYQSKLRGFRSDSYVSGDGSSGGGPSSGTSYGMINIYCMLMLIASSLSFFGAVFLHWPHLLNELLRVVTGIVCVLLLTVTLLYYISPHLGLD